MQVNVPRKLGLWVLIGILGCALIGLIPGSASAQTPEIRAYWADAFHAGAKSAAEVDALLSTVRNSNMNTVVVQMRKRGNTYYPSNYDPWAPDANTSFDALAYLIDKAHNGSPRIDVHCWFCMMPVWNSQSTPPAAGSHVYNLHPEWLTKDNTGATWDGSNYCIDPGVPAAAKYTNDVVMDVVNRYNVDGIHFDYVRYAGNTWGYNTTAVSRFNTLNGRSGTPTTGDSAWLQFRRNQVSSVVRRLYVDSIAAKPGMKVSASTITWGNGPTTESAWNSTSAYSDVLQDWRSWMEEGILDINMPMTYYDEAANPSYYDNWIGFEKSHKYNRQLAIGVGGYLNTSANTISQLLATRTAYNGYYADGQLDYCYGVPYVGGTASGFASSLKTNLYGGAVPVPDMPWKSSPTLGYLRGAIATCSGVLLDGANVSITGPMNKSIKTDGNGYYAFVDLTPGVYTVTASATGQPTVSTSVSVTPGNVATLNLNLCSDTTAPVISNVAASNITSSSATITWTTDDSSTSQVDYGTTTGYGSTTTLDNTLITGHNVSLNGLTPGQLYHFRVRSKNNSGLETVSGDYTFTTQADATGPVITNVQATGITAEAATITWTTDIASTSQVEYGTTVSYGQASVEDTALVTSHSVTITGLNANTTYHFRVKSTSGTSLTSYSNDGTFNTVAQSEYILDNDVATLVGSWSTGTLSADKYGADYRYATTAASQTATATWRPTLTSAGNYDVYCWYPQGGNRSAAAPYTVYWNGGSQTVNVNQQAGGGQWNLLVSGKPFAAGTAGYVELGNGTGEASLVVLADAIRFVKVSDASAPVITSVQSTNVTYNSATITWTTDDASTSKVEYGTTVSYGQASVEDTALVTSHSVTITGLNANTTYHFRVKSTNEASLTSYSGDNTFATSFRTEYILDNNTATFTGSWTTGTMSADKYGADYLYANTAASETATAIWRPTIDATGNYDVYCWYPQGANRSTAAPYTVYWNGGSQTVNVNQQAGGGQWNLLVSGKPFTAGTAGYVKLGNGTGEALVVLADAIRLVKVTVDVTPPVISSVASVPSRTTATVTWTTNEASTSQVEYGKTTSYGSLTTLNTTLVTSHSTALSGLSRYTTYHYRVRSKDAAGNEAISGDYTFTTK